MNNSYDETNIRTLEKLDVVRNRPTQFLNSTGIEGLIHSALEIITNGLDEIALMAAGGKLTILVCNDNERGTYQVMVIDNGRGLPIKKLRDSFTKLNTSGKFNTSAYEHSGGLFGVGAKVTCGTALEFKGISYCPDFTAALRVSGGKDHEVMEMVASVPHASTGVTVLYEPDPKIFSELDAFCEVGVEELKLIAQKWCYFKPYNIELRLHPLGLPPEIWEANIAKTEEILHTYLEDAHVVFSEQSLDRVVWLRSYWNISRPFAQQFTVTDALPSQDKHGDPIIIRYEVRVFYIKIDRMGGRLGLVNNVGIDDVKSTHILSVYDTIKLAMAPKIKDAPIRKYFLEQYRLPLYIAVDMKCPGAEFAGTTKNGFYSRSLRLVYEPSLKAKFEEPEAAAHLEAIYQELADTIESEYAVTMTGVVKMKNPHRLFENLKYPKNFKDCGRAPNNRQGTELFLIEGKSAEGPAIQGRDAQNQGTYTLRGKPFNGVIGEEQARQSAVDIINNGMYKDIYTIMNLNPAKFDPNALYFQRLVVMTDGDDHGYHIASLLSGNFSVSCPDFINSGGLCIVTPPLYSLDYKGRQKTPRIYFRDDEQLKTWLITEVYMRTLEFGIRVPGHKDKTYYLHGKDCVHFLRIILEIGAAIRTLAEELVIDDQILERLSHVTAYLYRNKDGQLETDRIRELMRVDRVSYKAEDHILVISVGRYDHVVPLQNVLHRMIETITPLLNLIRWRTTEIYITNKHGPKTISDQPISIMDLYTLLRKFDTEFNIDRYKGLGSMPPADMRRTCMDPELRNMFVVTSVGDVEQIFALLGNDSAPRKALIRR